MKLKQSTVKPNAQFHAVGNNAGTGLPTPSMMQDGLANTQGPSPAPDVYRAINGAVGANAMANGTTNSGSSYGNALMQLLGTQNNDLASYGQVQNPTLSGGQFPPGAPQVSGTEHLMGPSLMNSGGDASSDSIQRLDYLNGLPWSMPPSSSGAAVNGPPAMAQGAPQSMSEGPAQPGGMPQVGAILQQLYSPPSVQNSKAYRPLNAPQPPLNLQAINPSQNLGGGLR